MHLAHEHALAIEGIREQGAMPHALGILSCLLGMAFHWFGHPAMAATAAFPNRTTRLLKLTELDVLGAVHGRNYSALNPACRSSRRFATSSQVTESQEPPANGSERPGTDYRGGAYRKVFLDKNTVPSGKTARISEGFFSITKS